MCMSASLNINRYVPVCATYAQSESCTYKETFDGLWYLFSLLELNDWSLNSWRVQLDTEKRDQNKLSHFSTTYVCTSLCVGAYYLSTHTLVGGGNKSV